LVNLGWLSMHQINTREYLFVKYLHAQIDFILLR